MKQPEFLPVSREEMTSLGWDELDILLVSGDAYVDSHSFGVSLLGRWLVAHGYRVGIVAQPAWENTDDIARLGRPRLFAGISAGSVDSLLAHYTAFRKKRSQDAYSPGGKIDLRPNRAGIVYTGLVRQAFPGLPVVLGGIEASLRRASHYDFWSDSLRRSIVLDSKADAVLFGMAEKSILSVAELFSNGTARQKPSEAIARARLRGSVYAVHPDDMPKDAEELPSHEAIVAEPALLIKAAMAFEKQMLQGGPCLAQRSGGRAIVFEPPCEPLSVEEMDRVYGLPFTRRAHPSYDEPIPAVAMLEGSVASHRGCAGGCSFCALASHQGRLIQSRSAESILSEVGRMASAPDWKGSVTDVGGPSSNMWNAECAVQAENCSRESCLFPKRCRHFKAPQAEQADLLRRVGEVEGVSHVRVASGVRHDLAMESEPYMSALVGEFTGGQLKIAPEHVSEKVLRLMRKPPVKLWENFLKRFARLSGEAGKEQYIVPYLMSAFPGTTDEDMEALAVWLRKRGWRPQQVQCFIPTPGTVATAMFFAGVDAEGRPIQVARTDADRLRQHRILVPEEGGPPRKERRERDDRFEGRRERRPESRPPRGDKPPFRERKEYGGERKHDRDRPARPFSRDGEKRFENRPPRGDKPPFRERKDFGGERKYDRDRPARPFSRDGEKRFEGRPPRGDKPPFRERKDFGGERKYDRDRPARPFVRDGEKRFENRPPRGDKPPFRERKDFGGERKYDRDRPARPFERDGEKRFENRPPRGDKPPFRERKDFGGERKYDRDRPARPFARDGEKRFESRPPRGDKPPFRDRKESGGERRFDKPSGKGGPRPGGKPGFGKGAGGKPGFGGRRGGGGKPGGGGGRGK